jgi:TolB protein
MRLRAVWAALLLVAVGLAGCTTRNQPAAGPSGSGRLESVSPDPSPTAVPSASAPAGRGTPAGRGETLFYLSQGPSGGPTVLQAVTGTTVQRLASLPGIAMLSANVSPDGRLLSWVDEDATGDLMVASIDGTGRRDLGRAEGGSCRVPVWSPDSRKLMISLTDKRYLVDVATGTLTNGPKGDGCHPLWARDKISYGDGMGKVFLANPDGTGAWAIPGLGTGPAGSPRSLDFESLSPDGSRIVLDLHTGDMPDGDAARGLNANTVIDTRTGARVATPPLQQALFLPDGNLLVRNAGRLTELTPDGRTIRVLTEPAVAKDWVLLSYAPAG